MRLSIPTARTMKHSITSIFFVLCVLYIVKESQCYRILAIVPTPSYSHQIPYRPLLIELNKRGHDVVLVTTNPMDYKAPNFKQIDISDAFNNLRGAVDFVKLRFSGKTWIDIVEENLWGVWEYVPGHVFDNTEMKKIYAAESNETFDVLMTEVIFGPSLYAFAHRFDAPMIGLSSLGLIAINEHALGGIVLPSHEYTWEMQSHTGSNLPFLKRLRNFVTLWHHLYNYYHTYFPSQQSLAEEYLGKLPPLLDILRNTSMIFISQLDATTPARPKLANMITFTSSHISDKKVTLPKDLKKFLDDAKEGFIYFSLGTNAPSSDLPPESQRVIRDVLGKLPYRVVWKYETELKEKSNNIYAAPWFSQQSILGHPNIKLFIYQGGLQSSEEAIHFGVPVLGMPVLADQDYQVDRMEALGVGKRLEITALKTDEFENAIREIITNKEYKEKMLYLRNVTSIKLYDDVKHLAWWTEYVIETKGAPHLRSNLAWQPWYQRYDTDIVVFLTIVSVLIVLNALKLSAKLIAQIHSILENTSNEKQKIS